MKQKMTLYNSKTRNSLTKGFSMLVVFFMVAANTFAQVQPDKLRTIPTVEGDPTTEFLVATHLTDTLTNHRSFDPSVHCVDSNDDGKAGIQVTTGTDWFEYQIISPIGGEFAAVVGIGCDAPAAQANVSVYKTETEVWSAKGSYISTFTDNWHVETPFTFPLGEIEAGVIYTLRLSWAGSGSNIFSVKVIEVAGSTDATLSAIKVNGDTIPGFDPEVSDYKVALPPYQWIETFEAFANDSNATLVMPENIVLEDGAIKADATIVVTSESGIEKNYKIQFTTPVLMEDGIEWAGADMGKHIYFNNGLNDRTSKLNNFHNNEYIDFYVFSEFDDNYKLTITTANGYVGNSFINVSTLGLNDDTWEINEMYSNRVPYTGEGGWGIDVAQEIEYIFSLKEGEPTLLRVYGITNTGNTADVFGFKFNVVFESIDATASDIQVDGITLDGFDPAVREYSYPLTAGVTSVDVTATATDSKAQGVEGTGTLAIEGFRTVDTLKVVSESGFAMNYLIDFVAPVEVTDSISLLMADQAFMIGGPRVSNTQMNWFADSMYIDYYIYSATDKDAHVIIKSTNGNPDTVYSELNVSTFAAGSEWEYDFANSIHLPHGDLAVWDAVAAQDVKFNISLKGGEATILRLFAKTNASINISNIYGIAIVEGETDYVGLETTEQNNLIVVGGNRSINVAFDEAQLGGSIQIYDITGKLVVNEMVKSSNQEYTINRGGLYIVKVVGPNNSVNTVKCLVR